MTPFARLLEAPEGPAARLTSSLPDFALATGYLITWIAPYTFGDGVVRLLVIMIMFEFIILHSSALLMAFILGGFSSRGSLIGFIGLSAIYFVFAVGLSVLINAWWPFFTILLLTVNRALMMRQSGRTPARRQFSLIISWVMGFLAYAAALVLCGSLTLPVFGATPEVGALQMPDVGGSFVEEPHTALSAGFVYYLTVALLEVRDIPARLAAWLDW